MANRNSRFANYLRNVIPSNDNIVMEMAAKAAAKLALASGTYAADYVDFEVNRAFEWLMAEDRSEPKIYGAVSEVTISLTANSQFRLSAFHFEITGLDAQRSGFQHPNILLPTCP